MNQNLLLGQYPESVGGTSSTAILRIPLSNHDDKPACTSKTKIRSALGAKYIVKPSHSVRQDAFCIQFDQGRIQT